MRREILLLHESWHVVQEQVGFSSRTTTNAHLNTLEGRTWLRMEWRALRAALNAKDGGERRHSVAAALQFRRWRQQQWPHALAEELALESNEGLAESVALTLAGGEFSEKKKYLLERLAVSEGADFSRNFAYVTIPLYGILIGQGLDWLGDYRQAADIAPIVEKAFGLKAMKLSDAAAAKRLTAAYGYEQLRAEEEAKAKAIESRTKDIEDRYGRGPRLVLPVNVIKMTFNPNDVFPLGQDRIFYKVAEIQSEWGRLTVKDGVLVDRKAQTVTVAVPDLSPAEPMSGGEWDLQLLKSDGWVFSKGLKQQIYSVEREVPVSRSHPIPPSNG